MLRDNIENCRDWEIQRFEAVGPTEVTVYRLLHPHRGPLELSEEKKLVLIRESADLFAHQHYSGLIDVVQSGLLLRRFVVASLSPLDPAVTFGVSANVLFVGSYQTLYGISTRDYSVLFQVELPEGPEVSALVPVRVDHNDGVVVASDATVRLVADNGLVLWIAEFEDPVKVVSLNEQDVVLESVVHVAAGTPWRAKINLATGKSSFIR